MIVRETVSAILSIHLLSVYRIPQHPVAYTAHIVPTYSLTSTTDATLPGSGLSELINKNQIPLRTNDIMALNETKKDKLEPQIKSVDMVRGMEIINDFADGAEE